MCRPERIESSLKMGKIVIVAGFQGVSPLKEITTLGRGGSDTTAVALGIALKAPKVEFYKDVSGIFNEDPKKSPQAEHYPELTYSKALKIIEGGAKILHARAVVLAARNGLTLHVRSFKPCSQGHPGTLIFDGEDCKPLAQPIFE